jgi:hypothetical protein
LIERKLLSLGHFFEGIEFLLFFGLNDPYLNKNKKNFSKTSFTYNVDFIEPFNVEFGFCFGRKFSLGVVFGFIVIFREVTMISHAEN